ncbi:MAG: 4-hydroxybutyryl-CoA dehydratase [Spirochaetales bacterium]|jgi:4-hydroxybutyryl-CoA dehydratase / vinylacetyl-CoA-Delta-isomerase|nr:4-hydroxybutyryl-CoA dehydratase [Spirochaetales bacterium]
MGLMSGKEYRESLRNRRPLRVFMNGEKLEAPYDHPIIEASINSIALTYELADIPEYRDIMTAKSSISGKTINRFCHLHQSPDDLYQKIGMQRLLGQKCGTCFQRCVGLDAFNSIFITSFEIDQKYGTSYHDRFKSFLRVAEEKDWVADGCMTDAKIDRSLRPADQPDPDAYVRVVERNNDGVIIRGAKVHQTGALNSHEIIIMPTIAMRQEDKDYAICCAVPADDSGITYIYGRQSCDTRLLEDPDGDNLDAGSKYGGQECIMVFEDVFVPTDRIFMDGEWDFAGRLVETFAGYHRQSYACKTGVGDVAIGAAALIAEYNGVERASHIRDKIVEMNLLNETIWSCCVACSFKGEKTPAGNYLIDLLLANVAKQNVTRFPYEISRLLQDIAGGLMVTMPGAAEFENPETREFIEKYLKGAGTVTAKNRFRLLRLIENLTLGRAAVGYLTESMHGAGSPQAQRIMISRLARLDKKKELAKHIAGIEDES